MEMVQLGKVRKLVLQLPNQPFITICLSTFKLDPMEMVKELKEGGGGVGGATTLTN